MDKRYISLSVIFGLLLVTGLSIAEDAVDGTETSIPEAAIDTVADAQDLADEGAEDATSPVVVIEGPQQSGGSKAVEALNVILVVLIVILVILGIIVGIRKMD